MKRKKGTRQRLKSSQTRSFQCSSRLLRRLLEVPIFAAVLLLCLILYKASSPTLSQLLDSRRHTTKIHDEKIRLREQNVANSFRYNAVPAITSTTLKDPQLRKNARNSRFAILVLSSRENFVQRSMIRRTWGINETIFFAIGGCRHAAEFESIRGDARQMEEQTRLANEQALHQDLLDTIHPESYRSLPHKLRYGLSWVVRHLSEVEWILKADDDMFVRANLLRHVLVDSPSTMHSRTEAIILGHIVRNMPVQRGGKWAERNYMNHPIYPPWPQGSCGYVVSRAVGEYIAVQYEQDITRSVTSHGIPPEPHLEMYQGEDTSLGIWMEASNLSTSWIDSSLFVNHGDCMIPGSAALHVTPVFNHAVAWSIGHHIVPEQMLRCYSSDQKLNSQLLPALSIPPDQLFAAFSHVSTPLPEPTKDDRAYWSAVDLSKSDQEAKRRGELLVQRREERAQRRKVLQGDPKVDR